MEKPHNTSSDQPDVLQTRPDIPEVDFIAFRGRKGTVFVTGGELRAFRLVAVCSPDAPKEPVV